MAHARDTVIHGILNKILNLEQPLNMYAINMVSRDICIQCSFNVHFLQKLVFCFCSEHKHSLIKCYITCSRSYSLCVAMDTRLFQRTANMAVIFMFNQREPRHARAPKPIVSSNVVVGWRGNEFITHTFTRDKVELSGQYGYTQAITKATRI